MHYHHPKAISLAVVFAFCASLALTFPQLAEAKDANEKPVVKVEQKKEKPVKVKNKRSKKKQNEEESKPQEIKKELPPPPPPLTPDKRKYASPGGNQVMTDGNIVNFRSIGVINMHGYRYTYYSSNVLYHYKTPEWYACDDHIYRTKEGYIVVACGDHPKGTIVPTPFGPGIVLDHCPRSRVIDIYVNF